MASLRGYSYDPVPFQPEQVMLFELYDVLPKPIPRPIQQSRCNEPDEDDLLNRLLRFVQQAGEGQRHERLLKAATVAGGYIAAGRMNEQTATFGLETVASEWPTFSKSQKTIRDGLRYGQSRPIYAEDKPYSSPDSIGYARSDPTITKPDKFDVVGKQPVFVKTMGEQLSHPGSILRPDESSITRFPYIESASDYPADWG